MFDDIFDFNGDGVADTFEQIGGLMMLDALTSDDDGDTDNKRNDEYSSDWDIEDEEDDDFDF